MFEDAPELIVLICLLIDITITVALAVIAVKWHRKYQFLKIENSLMLKRLQILQTSNDLLKDTTQDLKNRLVESNVQRAELAKRNRELSDKLESAHKKLSIFSKKINEMKNS